MIVLQDCLECGELSVGIIYCKKCGSLLPKLEDDYNYFQVLSLDFSFNINDQQIDEGYENLLMRIHPDIFIGQGQALEKLSIDYAALAQQAKACLLHPFHRGIHMLKLLGFDVEAKNLTPNFEFLQETLVFQEKIVSSDPIPSELITEAKKNYSNNYSKLCSIFDDLIDVVQEEKFNDLCEHLGQFQYHNNILKVIKSKTTQQKYL